MVNLNLSFWERLFRYVLVPLIAFGIYLVLTSNAFRKMNAIANPGSGPFTRRFLEGIILFMVVFIATYLTENFIVDAATTEEV